MTSVLVLNGPNLNLLGQRQPHIYGRATLADVERRLRAQARKSSVELSMQQSNHEGVLVDWIHDARARQDGIIINPAGFTSTSVSILDALLAAGLPTVEVHITNIHRRESFRQPSLVSHAADAVIAGAGVHGYGLALGYLLARFADATGLSPESSKPDPGSS